MLYLVQKCNQVLQIFSVYNMQKYSNEKGKKIKVDFGLEI